MPVKCQCQQSLTSLSSLTPVLIAAVGAHILRMLRAALSPRCHIKIVCILSVWWFIGCHIAFTRCGEILITELCPCSEYQLSRHINRHELTKLIRTVATKVPRLGRRRATNHWRMGKTCYWYGKLGLRFSISFCFGKAIFVWAPGHHEVASFNKVNACQMPVTAMFICAKHYIATSRDTS